MTRRIAFVLAMAAGTVFTAPASADRECFDNSCRMPEVLEAPEAPPQPVEEPATAQAAPSQPALPPQATSGPVQPQMIVDALPTHEPLAKRPLPHHVKTVRHASRQHESLDDTVDVVAGRQYAAAQPTPGYSPHRAEPYPGAGIVVVVPGVQYGANGVGLEQSRQDPSWRLCQTDRPGRPCTPYNYQPYGAYGYRPMGDYRAATSAPAVVHQPGAKVIVVEDYGR